MYQQKSAKSDSLIALLLIGLLLLSTLIVSSVTIFIAERAYSNPFYFFNRHLVHLVLAGICFVVGYLIKPDFWVRYRALVLMVAIGLLVAVLVPGIGSVINGSRRWIRTPLMTIQTSDPAKLAFIMFIAAYASEKIKANLSFSRKWLPAIALLGIFDGLLLLQPDFGSAIVITGVVLQILFVAGMPILSFMMIIGAASIQGVLLAVFTPYRFMRIVSFLNPWLFPYSAGYQLTQSLMAIGRGGFWGVGLGSSLQKIFYLPEAHTDFIFAVFCEEIGAVGGVIVMVAFCTIVVRLIQWSYHFFDRAAYFNSFYLAGISGLIGCQFIVSAGVNMGILPTKGISMPLLSYGGTHMLTSLFAFGIVFRMLSEPVK
ncbi:MAG: putative lipid II flippase FtsW [Legionellales bacterium]|nr:putative lipid II flippase FtsW [Legionellales bacterium]HAV94120.1 putative lipid II flippase FtsW [Pseudomonadota bacterium]